MGTTFLFIIVLISIINVLVGLSESNIVGFTRLSEDERQKVLQSNKEEMLLIFKGLFDNSSNSNTDITSNPLMQTNITTKSVFTIKENIVTAVTDELSNKEEIEEIVEKKKEEISVPTTAETFKNNFEKIEVSTENSLNNDTIETNDTDEENIVNEISLADIANEVANLDEETEDENQDFTIPSVKIVATKSDVIAQKAVF